ncbi:MAG: DNA repair protein RecN [Myxococcales bacterium]|nr:DNA repair protein RecN [Myxococcales bacterium]
MLTALSLRDFAIAEQLELSFGPGLTVITGETGAGKSILIGALQLLLGGRASERVIRAGASRALLEAQFSLADEPEIAAIATERGFELEEGVLVVRRSIGRNGARRIWINGSLATVADLRAVAAPLVDLSTQHQQNRLLDKATHLELLDRMAGLLDDRKNYADAYSNWRDEVREYDDLRSKQQQQAERRDYLTFCVDEIEAAATRPGEIEELDTEARKLRAADELVRASLGANSALMDDGGARDLIAPLSRDLARAAEADPALGLLANRLDEVVALVDDLASDLERYAQRVDVDPRLLQEKEERLDLLLGLARKYGGSEEALHERVDAMRAELAREGQDASRLEQLERDLPAMETAVRQQALVLRTARQEAAGGIGDGVEAVIGQLGMEKARFAADVQPLPDDRLGPDGADRVQFVLASNPGEPAHPLTEVASGGELSRVLLGLKRACADADPVSVCVYDEVDAGLSGTTGVVLGRFLRELGDRQQVLCISHLPQVAAAAHQHIHVSKRVVMASDDTERTVSEALTLGETDRRDELARMLGGGPADATAAAHALQLMSQQRGIVAQA